MKKVLIGLLILGSLFAFAELQHLRKYATDAKSFFGDELETV